MELTLPRKEKENNQLELLEELNQEHGFTSETNGIDTLITFPHKFAPSGSVLISQMRPGIRVQIHNIKPLEKFTIRNRFFGNDPFEFNFYLDGYSRGIISNNVYRTNRHIMFELPAGQSLMMFAGADSWGFWEFWAERYLQAIEIHVEPSLIQGLMESNSQVLPSDLAEIIKGDREQTFWHAGIITPAMEMALHQLIGCPYQGMMKQMYLEGKALELVVLKLAQLKDTALQAKTGKVLKNDDIERIHYAREILVKNIDNPPSLLELARLAGINDYKLKLGFRQVFNTTVFGYLRSYRMEKARQLLVEENIKVSEVAGAVGYNSISRFNSAFKRQFGVTPSSCFGKNLK